MLHVLFQSQTFVRCLRFASAIPWAYLFRWIDVDEHVQQLFLVFGTRDDSFDLPSGT
jgi:hypothetical protein